MGPDQLLERGHLVELGVEQADREDVGGVLHPVLAHEARPGVRPERGDRVAPLDPLLVEVVDPVPAHRDRAVGRRAEKQQADPGMVRQRVDEAGLVRLDVLDRHPHLHRVEIDQPEVTRGGYDDIRHLPVCLLLPCAGGLRRRPGRRAVRRPELHQALPGPPAEGPSGGRLRETRELRQERSGAPTSTGRSRPGPAGPPISERTTARASRRSAGNSAALPVVRRPRTDTGAARRRPPLQDAAPGRCRRANERLRRPGTVVGDLVVVRVVDVDDRRAAVHLLDDKRRPERPQDDVGGGPAGRHRRDAFADGPARRWRRAGYECLPTNRKNRWR